MEVKLKKNEPMQIAFISHVGPYVEAGKLYEEIAQWLKQRHVEIAGPPRGWFYDNPEEVPAHKLRSEVGFPFRGEAKAERSVEIKKVPAQEVLYVMHTGPYREVGPAYTALYRYASEKGYIPAGCAMEVYLNDPAKVSESRLLTEIQLPIKKK